MEDAGTVDVFLMCFFSQSKATQRTTPCSAASPRTVNGEMLGVDGLFSGELLEGEAPKRSKRTPKSLYLDDSPYTQVHHRSVFGEVTKLCSK